MGPGEKARRKRARERKAAEYRAKLDAIRAVHPKARCGNCGSFAKHPYHAGHPPQFICWVESDFHGYALVQPDHLCPWWKEKAA